jgi:hypothetical protein
VNGEPLCYDGNCNKTSWGSRSYAYEGENCLVSVYGSVFFTYGPDGERIKKSGVEGPLSSLTSPSIRSEQPAEEITHGRALQNRHGRA